MRDAALELFATRGYQATTMDDIGAMAGIRGPSVYRHVTSKQDLLCDIVLTTMHDLIEGQRLAESSAQEPVEQLRRSVEAHVRYHARHRFEAAVGNREIASVELPRRAELLDLRSRYEGAFRAVLERGRDEGAFRIGSARLTSYAILDMGMGVAQWYRSDGPHTEDQVVDTYGRHALRLCGIDLPGT